MGSDSSEKQKAFNYCDHVLIEQSNAASISIPHSFIGTSSIFKAETHLSNHGSHIGVPFESG
jgi:hypothetical protein